MLTPIIHKKTRKVLGYIEDFTPNNGMSHRVMFRSLPDPQALCFELDGRVKERLEFIKKFGYRPRPSCTYAVNYRVKIAYAGGFRPLAVIVHGQRNADVFMRAMGQKARRQWTG